MKDLIIIGLTSYIVSGFDFWVDKPDAFPVYLFMGLASVYYLISHNVKREE